MVKKARIVHCNNQVIDFAPGVNNIVKRVGSICYYAVETFHSSPFWNKVTPVFASDIHSSSNIIDIYGHVGLRALDQHVVLLKNHPIRKVKIVGRITEYFMRELGTKTYYFLSIDDSSGHEILCKVSKSNLMAAGLNPNKSEGILIEAIGFINLYNKKFELHVDHLSILNNTSKYLKDELLFWQEALQIRKVIKTPWFQTLQIEQDNDAIIYKFDEQTKKRKRIQRGITLNSSSLREPETSPVVIDSAIYIRRKGFRRQAKETCTYSEDESYTDFEDATTSIFLVASASIELYKNQPKTLDKTWINISTLKSIHQPIKLRQKDRLIILLIKWILKNNQTTFNLNQPYKDPKIFNLIKITAQQKFPTQVVDLTNDNFKVKTVNEIHGEIFHEARHQLQSYQLLKCTRTKKCYADELFNFYRFLKNSLKLVKENCLCLNLKDLIPVYNNVHLNSTKLDLDLLGVLIRWILEKEQDQNWRFSNDKQEWTYFKSERSLKP